MVLPFPLAKPQVCTRSLQSPDPNRRGTPTTVIEYFRYVAKRYLLAYRYVVVLAKERRKRHPRGMYNPYFIFFRLHPPSYNSDAYLALKVVAQVVVVAQIVARLSNIRFSTTTYNQPPETPITCKNRTPTQENVLRHLRETCLRSSIYRFPRNNISQIQPVRQLICMYPKGSVKRIPVPRVTCCCRTMQRLL